MPYGEFTSRPNEKEPDPGRNCKDFKSCFLNRRKCKLIRKCVNAGDRSIYTHYLKNCDGVLHNHWWCKT